MSIIVRAGIDTVSQFANAKVTTKVGNKKHQVFFRLVCDDYSADSCIELAKRSNNIIAVEYAGFTSSPVLQKFIEPTGTYLCYCIELTGEVTEEGIVEAISEIPVGVTPVVKLPETFKDMKFIFDMCQKYPRVRFEGGMLFSIDGVRLGCCGGDVLDKLGIKYPTDEILHLDGVCEALQTVSADGLEFDSTSQSVKSPKQPKEKANKSSAPKKKSPVGFASLLVAGAEDL